MTEKDSLAYGTDPICGMQVEMNSPYLLDDGNQQILFCSKHCLERFEQIAPDVDPVCGMHVPAHSPYTLEEGDRLLRFCSVDCRSVYQRRRRTAEK